MRTFLGYVLVVAAAISPGACRDSTGPNSVVGARILWDAHKPSSYSYVASYTCFCLVTAPVEVQVVNGIVTSARRTDTGEALPTSNYFTIDDLFDQIASSPPSSVEFDARLGYPTKIYRCCLENDSGSIISIRDLTPLIAD